MNILKKFYKRSQKPLTESNKLNGLAYPISGLFYKTERGYFYIRSGKRYKVYSDRCFSSWCVSAIDTDFKNISQMPYAGILGFRDGTIIHNLADGKIYVVSDNKKLHIKTPDAFPEGWIEANKVTVSEAEVGLHKEGVEIIG
jgi:hypothetical protein